MKINLVQEINSQPQAFAVIKGNEDYSKIKGTVYFHQTQYGVAVITEVSGLPSSDEVYNRPVFGFHIHSGTECSGTNSDPFTDALSHYNPDNYSHPHHSGDMPPLFGNNGLAFSAFLTNRFSVDEILGKTVIIHSDPDDFNTQPSGNSGTKIACGKILRNM